MGRIFQVDAMTSPPPSPARPALTMTAADWALLVALSLLWGGSFYFAKVAVLEIPPLTLALGRVAIAAIVLAIVVRALAGPLPRDRRTWWDFTVMATLNNVVPFTLIFWGQIHISIGLASILNATSPLFSVLVAHVATQDDKLTPGRAVGLVAGFIGVVVLIGPDMLREFGTNALAELACLAASCAYAFGAVYARRLRAHSPFTIATGQLTMSAVLLLPLVLLFDRPALLLSVSSAAISAMVALAVLSTSLAYLIYFRILGRAGATNALLVTFLVPVSAILLGILLLGERLDLRQFAGMGAVAIGLAAIDGRPARLIARAIRRRAS
jgi:drug/metabolite transporter (DMT)-like permease